MTEWDESTCPALAEINSLPEAMNATSTGCLELREPGLVMEIFMRYDACLPNFIVSGRPD